MEEHNVLVVPQDRETPVQVGRYAGFAWRYAYHRASDTRKADDLGQDYLTFRYDGNTLVFALCDGVGQSFFGDLASRFLGDALMDWLWNDLPDTFDVESVRSDLNDRLKSITNDASRLVESQQLPGAIPRMLNEVLEQKREMGSESTFACGRIDLPGFPYENGRMVLAWMGDSRIRMWNADSERTRELGDTFKTEQRWSTRIGPVKGKPNVFVSQLKKGDRFAAVQLAVYSDGLALMDSYPRTPSTADVEALIDRATQSATSDDISFLEIGLGQAAPGIDAAQETQPEDAAGEPIPPELPAPRILSAVVLDRRLNASWEAIQGVKHYQVELDNGRPSSWEVRSTVWASPPLEPSNYLLRVRGVGDEPGEWSQATSVEVPAGSSPAPSPSMPAMPASSAAPALAASGVGAVATAAVAPPLAAPAPQPAPPVAVAPSTAHPPAAARSSALPLIIIAGIVVLLLLAAGAVALVLLMGSSNKSGSQQGAISPPQTAVGTQATLTGGGAKTPTQLSVQPGVSDGSTANTPTPTPSLSDQSSSGQATPAIPTATSQVSTAPRSIDGPVGLLQTLRDHTAGVTGVTFATDSGSRVLATGGADGKVHIYSMQGASWQPVLTRSGPDGAILSLAFSPDGKVLAAGDDAGKIWLWNAPWAESDGKLIRSIPAHNGPVRSLAFSPDSKLLASASDDKTARLWSIPSGQQAPAQALEHPDAVKSLSFSPGGSILATTCNDGTARFWAVPGGNLLRTLHSPSGPLSYIAYSPDGSSYVTLGTGDTASIWDATQDKMTGSIQEPGSVLAGLAFSPDGKTLALGAGGAQPVIYLVQFPSGKSLFALKGHTAAVTSMAFAPGGASLASGSDDKTVMVWGTGTDTPISEALTAAGGSGGAEQPTSAPTPTPTATPTPAAKATPTRTKPGRGAQPTATGTPTPGMAP